MICGRSRSNFSDMCSATILHAQVSEYSRSLNRQIGTSGQKRVVMIVKEIDPFDAPLTREEQLAYCAICLNRRKDAAGNYICSLTDDFAKFEDKCLDFIIDSVSKTRFLEKITKEIEGSLRKSSWISDAPGLEIIPKNAGFVDSVIQKEPDKHFFTMKYREYVLLVVVIFNILIMAGYWENEDTHLLFEFDRTLVFSVILMTALIFVSIYLLVRKRKIMTVGSRGIVDEKGRVYRWSTIGAICWDIVPGKSTKYSMRIYLFNGIFIKIDVSSYDVTKLGQYVNWHLKNSKDN